MSNLVDELKADHVALKHILRQAADLTKSALERVQVLTQAKVALLGHLDKENHEFYPPLKSVAARDRETAAILEVFAKDMEAIAPQALEFFDRYSNAEVVATSIKEDVRYAIRFGADLEKLITLLGLRIGREERTLYPQYDRVTNWQAA
jgi:hypothetical protein